MPRYLNCFDRSTRLATLAIFLAAAIPSPTTFALILGGEGNKPIDDPGWPDGAGIVFNQPLRIAYWEGPPFGGGEWHSECRGGAKLFNAMLADFAKIDAKTKRLVVHDGVGQSVWLNMSREPLKTEIARIDWSFTVWQLQNWKQVVKMSPVFKPADVGDANNGPPTQIDLYTGGQIKWADVVVPKDIEVIDQRLEAHGGSAAEGSIFEGTITDLDTDKPVAGQVQLQYMENDEKGVGHVVASIATKADEKGHWVMKLKIVEIGTWRVVVSADGFASRIVSQAHYDGQPGWHSFKGGLTRATTVDGHVADESGRPLAGVEVKLIEFVSHGERYDARGKYEHTTAADGHFHFDNVPSASASVRVHKPGYVHPGLSPTINTPANDVAITVKQSAQLEVTVDFAGSKRPESYIVELEPEGGNVVGSWGGSSQINDKNQVSFSDAPPGKYFLQGYPNPHSDKELSKRVPVLLKGGATEKVKLPAKNDG